MYPLADLSAPAMIPLGQLILLLACPSPVFDLAGAVLTSPFGPILRHRNGHCTRSRKNWSHGQSNFASHCAMLRMEIFQMTRAPSPVGSRFASLPLALRPVPNGSGLILSRNLRPVGLTSALCVRVHGPRVAGHASRITAFLIGNKVTIEIVPTHRKQRRASNSNR
jgi:hypothetical protein